MSSYSVVGTIGSVQAYFSLESETKSVYEQASKLPDKNCLLMELFTTAAKKEMQRRELASAELKLAKILASIARMKLPEDQPTKFQTQSTIQVSTTGLYTEQAQPLKQPQVQDQPLIGDQGQVDQLKAVRLETNLH